MRRLIFIWTITLSLNLFGQVESNSDTIDRGIRLICCHPSILPEIKILYIVNGEEYKDIYFLKPSEIKSLRVIESDSALFLYGEKGKDGALIITTKHPKKLKKK